jgi:hypothetical protein
MCQKSCTHVKLTWKRQIPKLDAKKFDGHGCTSFPPLCCVPKLSRFTGCTVETLRTAKTSTVALADDLNGCKRVRAIVQVLPTDYRLGAYSGSCQHAAVAIGRFPSL